MPYADDILLSYAHRDDRPLKDPQGWVSTLLDRLKIRVEELIGRDAQVWWDGRLQDNEYFVAEIGDRLTGTRFLVSVVTPSYVNSRWCRAEVREFCRLAGLNGGLRVRNLSRAFKVLKTPVEDRQLFDELRGTNGYQFFEYDARQKLREFGQETGEKKDQRYWDKLDDLAWDIKRTLEALEEQGGGDGEGGGGGGAHGGGPGDDGGGGAAADAEPARAALPLERKVYLAETASDVVGDRDRVWRELTQREFRVLPDRELPRDLAPLREAVRGHLQSCALSVHMLGAGYGFIPDGGEHSVVRVQEELAAERAAADPAFTRLIWMPAGLTTENPRQSRYVEELHRRVGPGDELLQTSVEGLKARVLEKLDAPPADGDGRERTRVYVIHEQRDEGAAAAPAESLRRRFEVRASADAGGGERTARYHRESLVWCDAALVYDRSGGVDWLQAKIIDLQKARGWRGGEPMLGEAVYLAGPPTKEKEALGLDELLPVIRNPGAFTPGALEPFLAAVAAGERRAR